MNKSNDNYLELTEKLNKLISENKRLRLRPSMHSTEAKIYEFMNVKSKMAHAMLNCHSIKEAIEVSAIHLTKIDNIHSITYFQRQSKEGEIKVVKQKSTPKKFLSEFENTKQSNPYRQHVFPTENLFFSSSQNSETDINNVFDKHLSAYQSKVVLPIIEIDSLEISLLLLSKKSFLNNKYFNIITGNLQAQLRSSFTRIILQEKITTQSKQLEESIKQKVADYESVNKELMSQVRNSKLQIQDYIEELELYRGIVIKQKDIILRINTEGYILFQNPAFSDLKSITGDESNNLIAYLGEGDFPGLTPIINDFENGIQQINCEIQVLLATYTWFNFYFTPIKNSRGLILEIQVSARNINQIKSLEEKLRSQKAMAHNMLNNSTSIHFTMNTNGQFVFLSEKWEHSLGYNYKECIDKEFKSFVPLKDREELDKLTKSLVNKKDRSYSSEIKLITIDGDEKHFSLHLIPTINKDQIINICGFLKPNENI